MGLFPPHRLLLIVLAAVVSLVAPVASVAAAPGDAIAASAQVEPAVVRVDTAVDYQGVIGTGTGHHGGPMYFGSLTCTCQSIIKMNLHKRVVWAAA